MSDVTQIDGAGVVIVGAGAAGLAAAVAAAERGASVLVVEENTDIGGHAILSGGWVMLGGGHRLQHERGIVDSPEAVYDDWVASENSRFDDRELVWAFAQESAATFELLLDSGVSFGEEELLSTPAWGYPTSAIRGFHAAEWPDPRGVIAPHRERNGSGVVRPLERRARELGVRFRMGCSLVSLLSEDDGSVAGLIAHDDAGEIRIAAGAVVLATGGHTSNVDFRRIFDPRLTEEYQVAGEPYARQSAAGEVAALQLGAVLWGTAAQSAAPTIAVTKSTQIGCRWGYQLLVFEPDSPIFDRVKATGIEVDDWSDLVLVAGEGRRFWDETDSSRDFVDAALAAGAAPRGVSGGGPVWAVFDQAQARRSGWVLDHTQVDREGFFFSADTIEGLAEAVRPIVGRGTLRPEVLARTLERYNHLVDEGRDEDFGKRGLRHRIDEPPFYAAWATPILHDSLTGLRTTAQAEVVRLDGRVFQNLFAAGECQGGVSLHGLGRCLVFGRVAGIHAAATARRRPGADAPELAVDRSAQ